MEGGGPHTHTHTHLRVSHREVTKLHLENSSEPAADDLGRSNAEREGGGREGRQSCALFCLLNKHQHRQPTLLKDTTPVPTIRGTREFKVYIYICIRVYSMKEYTRAMCVLLWLREMSLHDMLFHTRFVIKRRKIRRCFSKPAIARFSCNSSTVRRPRSLIPLLIVLKYYRSWW